MEYADHGDLATQIQLRRGELGTPGAAKRMNKGQETDGVLRCFKFQAQWDCPQIAILALCASQKSVRLFDVFVEQPDSSLLTGSFRPVLLSWVSCFFWPCGSKHPMRSVPVGR